MSISSIHLSFENKLILDKKSGTLNHAFGEGYFIIDEYGREINTFTDENEFNRLIEKFRYRYFLIEKLNEMYNDRFDFGEDNTLMINGKTIENMYWDLPKNDSDVDLFLKAISDKITSLVNT